MHLHRAEGFLYTKHPAMRRAQPIVTRDLSSADVEMFGYAYTARRLPRPPLVATLRDWGLKLVFGYAYTARYERLDGDRSHNDAGRIAA